MVYLLNLPAPTPSPTLRPERFQGRTDRCARAGAPRKESLWEGWRADGRHRQRRSVPGQDEPLAPRVRNSPFCGSPGLEEKKEENALTLLVMLPKLEGAWGSCAFSSPFIAFSKSDKPLGLRAWRNWCPGGMKGQGWSAFTPALIPEKPAED